jgi:xanthine dehydrogenase accessory factor
MAVAENGEVVGSVSGGCVEGAVYELASEVLRSGRPALVTYGVSQDDAFEVGLTCGGVVEILVQPGDDAHYPELSDILSGITGGAPIAVAQVIAGRDTMSDHLVVTPRRGWFAGRRATGQERHRPGARHAGLRHDRCDPRR